MSIRVQPVCDYLSLTSIVLQTQTAVLQAIAAMVTKSRSRVYGKRRCNDLVTAFDNLNISPAVPPQPLKASIAGNKRSPFEAVPLTSCHPISSGESEELEEFKSLRSENTSTSTKASPQRDPHIGPRKAYGSPAQRRLKPKAAKAEVSGIDKKARADVLPQEQMRMEPQQPHSGKGRRGRKPNAAKAEVLRVDPKEVARPTPSRRLPRSLDKDRSERPSPSTSNNVPTELIPLLALPYISTPAPLSFSAQYAQWATDLSITKVAQGSYASILRLALPEEPFTYTIWKLMPLKPRHGKGSRMEGATCIEDAIAELRLLEAMSKTPGFVEFRSAMVLKGAVPKDLQEVERLWHDEEYNRVQLSERKEDACEDGEEEREYGPEQLWLFVEMSDAGEDVENWLKRNLGTVGPREVWDLFWGTAEAVAQGEAELGFEHRDLHLGNICVKKRKSQNDRSYNGSSEICEEASGSIVEGSANEPLVRRFTDLEVTLIDYTLSRASIDGTTSLNASSGHAMTPASPSRLSKGEDATHDIFANSMRDPALFTQDSEDPLDQLQYDTYRHMRDIMARHHCSNIRKPGSDDTRRGRMPKVGTEEQWKTSMPATNLLWLHHVCVILMLRCGFDYDLQLKKGKGVKSKTEPVDMEARMILDRLREVKKSLWKAVEVAMGRREVTDGDEEVWESAVNVLESEIIRERNVA